MVSNLLLPCSCKSVGVSQSDHSLTAHRSGTAPTCLYRDSSSSGEEWTFVRQELREELLLKENASDWLEDTLDDLSSNTPDSSNVSLIAANLHGSSINDLDS